MSHWSVIRVSIGFAAVCGLIALAGCSDGPMSSMLNGQSSKVVQDKTAKRPTILVALATFHGPPAEFNAVMVRELNVAADRHDMALLVDPNALGDYVLKGNFIGTYSGKKALLAYNWDVLDKSGARISRTGGEESQDIIPTKQPVWSTFSPGIIKTVAGKAVDSLASMIKPVP